MDNIKTYNKKKIYIYNAKVQTYQQYFKSRVKQINKLNKEIKLRMLNC